MPLCGRVQLLFGSWVLPLCLTCDVCLVLNLLLNAKFCRKLKAENEYLDCAKQGACLPLNREDCNDERYGVNTGYEDENILQDWWTVDTAVLAENDIPQHILRCQLTPSFCGETTPQLFGSWEALLDDINQVCLANGPFCMSILADAYCF